MTNDPNIALPSAVEAEKHVLGSMLLMPESVAGQARGRLKAEDFYLPAHQFLFKLILEKVDAREPVEPVSLLQTILDRQQIGEIGSAAMITELLNFSTGLQWEWYADVILDKAARRRGMSQMGVLWKAFADSTNDWKPVVSQAQMALTELLTGSTKQSAVSYRQMMAEAADVIEERMESRGKIIGGLLTGLTDVDRMFMGTLTPSSICTIAGRPSMGKSVLLQGIAERIASGWGDYEEYDQKPGKVLFISTEMQPLDLSLRAIAARSGVNIKKITDGRANSEDFMLATTAISDLSGVNCHVEYMPGASAEKIASRIHAWDSMNPDTVAYVIDHMTDVDCDGVKDKSQQPAITLMVWMIITNAIKHVGKVGFLGCQLSKGEGKEGQMPKMNDLKGSTKIQEASSHIIFIHRPHYYELRKEKQYQDPDCDPNAAVFMIAKNRNGRCGPIGAWFDAEITRFRSETRRLYSDNPEEWQKKRTFHNQ